MTSRDPTTEPNNSASAVSPSSVPSSRNYNLSEPSLILTVWTLECLFQDGWLRIQFISKLIRFEIRKTRISVVCCFHFLNFHVCNLTAAISPSGPPRFIFKQKVHYSLVGFFFFNIQGFSEITWDVSDVDLKAISGSVIATGLKPVLPPLRWIKCNITRPVSSVCSAKRQKYGGKKCGRISTLPEGGLLLLNKGKTRVTYFTLLFKVDTKRFCWKHSFFF